MRSVARVQTSRRNLLGLGGAAAAAMGIAALTPSKADAAAGDNLVLGEINNAGQEPTTVNADVDGPAAAFYITNTAASGAAIVGSSAEVRGAGTTGPYGAVTGDTSSGYGVVGRAAPGQDGVGLFGFNEQGFGLEVFGANKFSQGGSTTVVAGQSAKTVNDLNLQVGKDSVIVATAQGNPTDAHVVSAKRLTAHRIRIFLSGPAPAGGLKVGYFVVN